METFISNGKQVKMMEQEKSKKDVKLAHIKFVEQQLNTKKKRLALLEQKAFSSPVTDYFEIEKEMIKQAKLVDSTEAKAKVLERYIPKLEAKQLQVKEQAEFLGAWVKEVIELEIAIKNLEAQKRWY